jgi:TRAP-type C4-dicarboxylate transport system substrate-binding protein
VVKAGNEAREQAEKRGNEIFVLSEEETQRWREATQPVVDNWLKSTPNGEKLLEQARALLDKYSQA